MTVVVLAHLQGGAVATTAVSNVSLARTLARLQCTKAIVHILPALLRRHGAIYVMCTNGDVSPIGRDVLAMGGLGCRVNERLY